MARTTRVVPSLTLALVLAAGAGCSASKPAHRDGPVNAALPPALRDALTRTLAVRSIRAIIDNSDQAHPGPTAPSTVEVFGAPERLRTERHNPDPQAENVRIRIGPTTYFSIGADRFYAEPTPPSNRTRPFAFLPLESAAAATHVRGSGNDFTFTTTVPNGASATGTLRVERGWVVHADYDFPTVDANEPHAHLSVTYSEFNAAPPVTAPPANRIVPAPTNPECARPPASSEVGPAQGCPPGGPPTTVIALPAPTVHEASPLTLRTVLGSHPGDCPTTGTTSTAGPADRPVVLGNGHGTCFDLGPTLLTITHAVVTPLATQQTSSARLTLDPPDAAALDRVAADQFGKQIAVVMFDRVLVTPSINAREFNGTATISGIDTHTIADVIVALR